MTNEEIDELMKDANIDDNGYINYEEFIKILLAKWYFIVHIYNFINYINFYIYYFFDIFFYGW